MSGKQGTDTEWNNQQPADAFRQYSGSAPKSKQKGMLATSLCKITPKITDSQKYECCNQHVGHYLPSYWQNPPERQKSSANYEGIPASPMSAALAIERNGTSCSDTSAKQFCRSDPGPEQEKPCRFDHVENRGPMSQRNFRIANVETFSEGKGMQGWPPHKIVQHDARCEVCRRVCSGQVRVQNGASEADLQTDGGEQQ
jgi:hypothetical protein